VSLESRHTSVNNTYRNTLEVIIADIQWRQLSTARQLWHLQQTDDIEVNSQYF